MHPSKQCLILQHETWQVQLMTLCRGNLSSKANKVCQHQLLTTVCQQLLLLVSKCSHLFVLLLQLLQQRWFEQHCTVTIGLKVDANVKVLGLMM